MSSVVTYYNLHTHRPSLLIDSDADCRIVDIINTDPLDDFTTKLIDSNSLYSCGIHPWCADSLDEKLSKLESLLISDHQIVALGEIGLDKLKGPNLDIQMEVFEQQICLAIKYGRPIIIHCVKCWDQMIALRKKYQHSEAWVIHGFRGNYNLASQLLDHGFKLSLGAHFNSDAVKRLPLNSFFCETDNSAFSIINVYSEVAQILNTTTYCLINTIEQNIKSLFVHK